MINWKRIFKRYLFIMALILVPLFAYIAWNGRIPSRYIDDEVIYARLLEESDFGMKLQFADGGWVKAAVYSSRLPLDVYNAEAYLLFDDSSRLKLAFVSQYKDYGYELMGSVGRSITRKEFMSQLGYIFAYYKILR